MITCPQSPLSQSLHLAGLSQLLVAGSMVTQGYDEMAEIAQDSAKEVGDNDLVKGLKQKGADVLSAFSSDKSGGKSEAGQKAEQQAGQADRSAKDVAHDSTEQAGSMLGGIKDSARQMASNAQQYVQGAGSSNQTAVH